MPEVVSELIITIDGFAHSTRSPAYYGFWGPQFEAWLKEKNDQPHQVIIGRRTYEALNALPNEARDEEWARMTATPGWVFSRTLETIEWPGLEIVRTGVSEHVGQAKQRDGDEIRTLGSISLIRQLVGAGLVDRLRLIMCPLVLPKTGSEPVFSGMRDTQFKLSGHRLLDGRVLILLGRRRVHSESAPSRDFFYQGTGPSSAGNSAVGPWEPSVARRMRASSSLTVSFWAKLLALRPRKISRIDQSIPIVAETDQIMDRRNSSLKSRAQVFGGSTRRFFIARRKNYTANSTRYHMVK